MLFSYLAFGADHAGEVLCTELMQECATQGKKCDKEARDGECIDYPMAVPFVVERVKKGAVGVLVCGSGIGMSIAANRHQGIRAALCCDVTSARLARQHNDANVLVLGARVIGRLVALDCLRVFLSTAFEGGRHQARIESLDRV